MLLIIVLGLFLRLTRANDLFHFEMDEEVIAWKTQKFWRDGQPFLIGGGTPFGVHLGPAFYYLSSIPLIFTKGNPIGWIVLTSLLSISNLYLMFLVGKTLYSETVGLIAAALWAFSFTSVMFDRHWWPLALDPLLALLTMLSLFHIMKGHAKWWIVLGLTLAFAWQADLTNLVLFIASGIVIAVRIKQDWKHIGLMAGIIAFSLLPLVVFELRHPGANLGNLLRSDLSFERSDLLNPVFNLIEFIPSTFASLLIPSWRSSNLADWYTWCKDVAASRISFPPIMMIVSSIIFLYPVISWFRKKQTSDLVVIIFLASGITGITIFRLFGGDLFDFYLAPLYPVFLLSVSITIVSLILKLFKPFSHVAIVTILIVLLYLNINSFFSTSHSQSFGLKQQAVSWVIQQVGERPFVLESISRCHRYNGIRYLFMLADNEPVMSFMDPTLSWLYDTSPAKDYPSIFVVFVTPNDLTVNDETRYNELKRRAIDSTQFGDFDVVIDDNNGQRFQVDFSDHTGTSD